jgi:hypothetical protein
MRFVILCIAWFLGYFTLRFGMVSRGSLRQIIEFLGGTLCIATLISSFFLIGWVKGFLGLLVFWFVVTPITEIIIRRIEHAINRPYEEIYRHLAEQYPHMTPEEIRKLLTREFISKFRSVREL